MILIPEVRLGHQPALEQHHSFMLHEVSDTAPRFRVSAKLLPILLPTTSQAVGVLLDVQVRSAVQAKLVVPGAAC